MMQELLQKLSESGVRIWAAGDQLGVSAPRDALTAELREELRRCKPQLLELVQANETAVSEVSLPRISPRPEERFDPFPLSDVQQAYLFGRTGALELGNVTTHYYSEREAEHLDLERLTVALNRVIARHEMLRAVFSSDGTQRVLREVPTYRIAVHDVRGRDPVSVQAEIARVRDELSHQVLPADRWPLFEIRAVLGDAGRVRLYVSLDALIVDVWSIYLIFDEWQAFYREPARELPPIELSYRDYILAERSLEDSGFYRKSREYWLGRTETLPPGPDLPILRDASTMARPRFTRRRGHLEREAWRRLNASAKDHGLTPSGLLMAAYAEILARWSKTRRFTVNLTLFNRLSLHNEVNSLIGDFTSLTLLEVDYGDDVSFARRALKLQQQLWRDLDHRYFSGVRVLREQSRRRGNAPAATMPVVFTSALGLGGSGRDSAVASELGREVYGISQTPQVWLDLQVMESDGELVFNWDAVEALFPEGMLDAMFEAFGALLTRLATAGEVWNVRAPVELPAAQRALQDAANATDVPLPVGLLHSALATRAAENGDAVAVIAPERELTYRDLERLSNRVAHRLRALGVLPNTLVAVVMARGWEQVVAVYGILAAGAAYVPVDPELPRARRDHLLAEGEVSIVLTQSELDAELEWPLGVRRLCVDSIVDSGDDSPLGVSQQPTDLAYVIYTSGSTGKPKGVSIDHRGALNTVLDVNRRFEVGPTDRVLALSSLSFDLSVYDFFGTIAAGGAIVILDPALSKEPTHWIELMMRHHVSVWNSVPQLFQILVDSLHGKPDRIPEGLRLAMLSGDWLPVTLNDRACELWRALRVVSLGGATEASIWSIHYPIHRVDPSWTSIPYGKPLCNQHFHVLDQHMQPRPVWVPGTLYIGGVGLARNYWHNPTETAARFVTHPDTGERLYDTGDLGRYLPDGNIEFLGREDFQVKINGHRIELGEIAAAIQQHPGVETAIVDVLGEDRQSRQLCAYVVPADDPQKYPQAFESVPAAPEMLEAWRAAVSAASEQPLPAPEDLVVFSDLWRELERISTLAMCRSLRRFGVFQHPGETHEVGALVRALRIEPHYGKLLGQWLQALSEDGLLEEVGPRTFASSRPLPDADVDELWAALRASAWAERVPQLFEYFERSAENHVALFRGELDALELLFPGGSWDTAESIYQHNPIATYLNWIAREVLGSVARSCQPSRQLNVLEVGAGTGGTTASLLPVMFPDRASYTYTDLSTFFTARAKDKFQEYPFLDFRLLDINADPLSQGYTKHTYDVIVAANVLHDARHVRRTLTWLRDLLVPGGCLLVLETTRNTRLQRISVSFVEGLGDYEDERLATNLPLFDTGQWRSALAATAFEEAAFFPGSGSPAEVFGQHVFVARAPATVSRFDTQALLVHLNERLPEYMVPRHVVELRELPLTANGKVDRQALLKSKTSSPINPRRAPGPASPLEQSLLQIWRDSLRLEHVEPNDDFFALGGDSLIAMQLGARINAEYGVELPLRRVFEKPTVAELAAILVEAGVDPALAS